MTIPCQHCGGTCNKKTLATGTGAALLILFIAACGPSARPPSEPRIDASSDEAMEASIPAVKAALPEDRRAAFEEALKVIAFKDVNDVADIFQLGQADTGAVQRALREALDGKTGAEVIAFADGVTANRRAMQARPSGQTTQIGFGVAQPEPEPKPEPEHAPPLALGSSATIDGIEITVTGARIAPLEESGEPSLHRIPEGQFLVLYVALRNVSEGRIVYLQKPWSETVVEDDFGNTYSQSAAVFWLGDEIKGRIGSLELRPGGSATDIMIFDLPVEKASRFVLRSDPQFYRRTGNATIQDLSDDTFTLEFTRSDIAIAPSAAPTNAN
jgi:hypothetical protein